MKTVFCQSCMKSQDSRIVVVKHNQIVFFLCVERSSQLWSSVFKIMGKVLKASMPEGFQKEGEGPFLLRFKEAFQTQDPRFSSKCLVNLISPQFICRE